MKDLKAKGAQGEPWAICTASLKKAGKLAELRRRKHAELRKHRQQCHCHCDACQLNIAPTFRRFAEKFGEGSSNLHSVEIFATGVHRDKPYTEQDLADMVSNFRLNSMPRAGKKPLVSVPAVLGHEEDQSFLERSDLPAAAWAKDVWQDKKECPQCGGSGMAESGKCGMCRGNGEVGVLKADFSDVPPKVARLLKGKAYKQVSAEVYDEPPEGLGGSGKMLRRVAFPGWRDPAGEVARRHPRTGGAQRAA